MTLTLFTTPVSVTSWLRRARAQLLRTVSQPPRNCARCSNVWRGNGFGDAQGIPNPDLVHAYMAECGIGEDKVKLHVVNVMTGENRSPEFVKKNPQGTVPALELEDGRVMAESTMICQYLDEIHGPTCEICTIHAAPSGYELSIACRVAARAPQPWWVSRRRTVSRPVCGSTGSRRTS